MLMRTLKRGKSQILFRHLPGSVFMQDKKWYKVDDFELVKVNDDTTHLLNQVLKIVKDWRANEGLKTNLFPTQEELYYFAEIQQINYNLFPLVFHCDKCNNVHEYYRLDELQKKNPLLKCTFCKKGSLIQYPYALIHANGDIQSLKVPTIKKATGLKKYDGIKMRDTKRFTTATWYNSKTNESLGSLGIKSTNLPITEEMAKNNNRFLGGVHLADGDVHYPAIRSVVNLTQSTLTQRQKNNQFAYIQLAALFNLQSVNRDNYDNNFREQENNNPLLVMLNNAKDEGQRELLLKMIKDNNLENEINKTNFKEEIESIFNSEINIDRVKEDRLLHEFNFSWFENEGKSLDDKILEARDNNDYLQETTLIGAKKELNNLGFDSVLLLEKFPVVTLGIGFTRKNYDRSKAILNPFPKIINNRKHAVIPVLKNENEAIIFKFDAQRVFAWLKVNKFIETNYNPKNKEQAHAFLYNNLQMAGMDIDEISQTDPSKASNEDYLLASVLTYQLIHTQMHILFNAGKSIFGLDVDSMSEYIFPSALAGAIYVSKLQGGGMGTLIAAFENDLERWLRNSYEKSQTCLYDPICKGQQGACHACSYLKFSCQHFNRGLSRNLLIGGEVLGIPIIGYYSREVDEELNSYLSTLNLR